ncbi:MAG TPA: hypothetical protein VLA74_13740 [Nitrososphaeraceae archaeon]|nr:hypothetical protein [Nitrososphaeraceae archaeon]
MPSLLSSNVGDGDGGGHSSCLCSAASSPCATHFQILLVFRQL